MDWQYVDFESIGFMLFAVILTLMVLIGILIYWQKKAYSKYADKVYGLLINYPNCYMPWRCKELWLDGKTPLQASAIMKAENRRSTDHR